MESNLKSIVSALLLITGGAFCGFGAQAHGNEPGCPPEGRPMEGRPPGPPPGAIEACVGKTAAEGCSVTMPDGKTLSGTCETLPPPPPSHSGAQGASAQAKAPLACRPSDMPPPPGEKRNPEREAK
ncbi:hypothetical protein [Propionivibrio soli]|uniref:hypothetical protein n=1 Tax=Propionivibrio soli TaxID=2976531 RepID=UPI0021E7CCB4|nr:hypothetical protein [Propionivibrio soli]